MASNFQPINDFTTPSGRKAANDQLRALWGGVFRSGTANDMMAQILGVAYRVNVGMMIATDTPDNSLKLRFERGLLSHIVGGVTIRGTSSVDQQIDVSLYQIKDGAMTQVGMTITDRVTAGVNNVSFPFILPDVLDDEVTLECHVKTSVGVYTINPRNMYIYVLCPGLAQASNFGRLRMAWDNADINQGENKLYRVYINNDQATVDSLYYNELPKKDWRYRSELGEAVEVDIAFDGVWEVAGDKKELTTEGDPWIFRIDGNGYLHAQWGRYGPAYVLSENCVKLSAIKGWQNILMPDLDQGLVVAYTKTDGNVYYRNYALQVSGSKIWEVESQIVGMTSPIDDIALFRSNDYRLGLLCQYGDQILMTMTDRNGADMAIEDHRISVGLTDYTITIIAV